MRSTRLRLLSIPILLLALQTWGQNVNTMHPDEIRVQKHASPEDLRARLADAQLQKDSKELSDLCAAMPTDLDHLKQGLLPQDLQERLKRIEKLSKRIREQLARTGN